MKAVIMAGGEGTRLRPLTSLRPKPMVPIVNQPVMEHILGLVKHHGITEVVATLQFMPNVIEDYFRDGEEWGMSISYTVEETPLGTAGSVKYASEVLDETFLVISGDALTDIDLAEVVRFHKEKGGIVTIALKRVPDPLEFGVVITAEDGRIERFLEKPTWGQVFSDTINTGIYVMEPEVFDYIPAGEQFDFSSQLFPLLMEKGYDLYGCVVDGYWCDVGSLLSYVQVHRDVLDGKAMIYVPGMKTSKDVYVGKGAEIDATAQLGRHVVVGENSKVRAGALIGDYTVIGDNCVVGEEGLVSHSIMWNDGSVGSGASVRGAVLQRKADVRARARVEFGAVIGDESTVGEGASVGNDVSVYPFKRIEPAAEVNSSIIWESRASRTLFGAEGVSGLLSVDITPEVAVRLAEAYGTILPAGGHVLVSRDGSRAARMIKRALVAGLNSSGVNVRDLRVASPAVTRFTTRETRCVGGVHICLSSRDPQRIELHFYDAKGLDLSPNDEKKVERLYFRNEFRRAFFDEVGEIIYPPRAMEYYASGMEAALGEQGGLLRPMKVVADLRYGVTSFVLPHVAASWKADLIALHPFLDSETTYVSPQEQEASLDGLQHHVCLYEADLGALIEVSGERLTFVTKSGRALDPDTALHAMVDLWCRTDTSGTGVAVPLSASHVVERIAAGYGREVVRTGRSRRALAEAAMRPDVGFAGSQDGAYIFASFLTSYDAVMSLGMVIRMLRETGEDLDAIVDALPTAHLIESSVFCPPSCKGSVMRSVAEEAAGDRIEMQEGIRVFVDDGWALVLPHSSEAIVELFAEGPDDTAAHALLQQFEELVSTAVARC